MQAGCVDIERRSLGPDGELTGWPAFLAEAHGQIVALHQCFEAADSGQGNRRFDHPELAAVQQQFFGTRIHGQLRDRLGKVAAHVDPLQGADLYAVVHHCSASRLQTGDILELEHHLESGFSTLVIVVKTERQGWVGRRAVLAMFGRGEGDATSGQADQRFGAQPEAGQTTGEGQSAGIPEAGVLAYQMGVRLFDIDLQFDGTLVFGKSVAFHLADLDLPVVDRAALFERAQTLGLEGEVQAGQAIR